jgi:hypothetical protein
MPEDHNPIKIPILRLYIDAFSTAQVTKGG